MNDYTTPDERAALARGVHEHLPEDRRVQMRQDDLGRLAEGLPGRFTADETAAALLRWTAPDEIADVPWTTSRAGFDAVVAARARRDETRGVFEHYDPRSRVVTGIVMPAYAVSEHRGHTVMHTGQMDVVSLDVADVPVHWSHETGVRCGSLVGAIVGQRRAQGMRLGEVSLTESPAFGMDETAVKRVADVPRFASETLRRERHDEHEVRALEAGVRARSGAASRVQTRVYPSARITVR
ncbi:hypothetical protein [Isoptericola nanjingensis]|uniref:hypothetical protein n=1 Tax=Isoptericola nanjingensis TaxID=903413 RepID=UPI003D26211F